MLTTKAHNDALAKLIQKNLKADLPSVTMQRQGYKGTGSKSYKRQIVVRFEGDRVTDLWLEDGTVRVGGVYAHGGSSVAFRVADRSPEESYQMLLDTLRARGY